VPGPLLRAESSSDALQLRGLFVVSRQVLRIAAQIHGVELTGDV
jgi:hypothetical protein